MNWTYFQMKNGSNKKITRKIGKSFEMNENEDMTYQTWDATKVMLGEKFINTNTNAYI